MHGGGAEVHCLTDLQLLQLHSLVLEEQNTRTSARSLPALKSPWSSRKPFAEGDAARPHSYRGDPGILPPIPPGVGPPQSGFQPTASVTGSPSRGHPRPTSGIGAPARGIGPPSNNAGSLGTAPPLGIGPPASGLGPPASNFGPPIQGMGYHSPPSAAGAPSLVREELEDGINHIQARIQHLRTIQQLPRSPTGNRGHHSKNEVSGDVSQAELDAELAKLEGHISKLKAHHSNAASHSAPPPDPLPPVDMPHWEHHKYDHHEITTPAWHAQKMTTDIYGEKHNSNQYGFKVYGAGSHGHHLAHYHLNDYHGLAHHSFKNEEYHKASYGSGGHGHSVPHLHGMGQANHHGSHAYKGSEYHSQSYGKHAVPHLHGIGTANHHA